jgi:FAD/FMN-containing dehydrogenase
VLRKAPPLPFLPAEWHGKEILAFAACYSGDPAKGQQAMAPLRALGKPIADVIAPHPFLAWQAILDPLLTPGMRNYWKSHSFTTLSDGAIDALIEFAQKLPSPECEIAFAQLGGAINKVPATATAYPHRDIQYVVNLHTRWGNPADDEKCIAWARGLFDALTPHATGGVYVNFMPEDEAQRVRSGAYGANYERLARLKAKYDPDNLFRVNVNIRPGA